jgi:hypothetical protein
MKNKDEKNKKGYAHIVKEDKSGDTVVKCSLVVSLNK